MTTKNEVLNLNNGKSYQKSQQYSNFNLSLNQNQKCLDVSVVQSRSKSCTNSKNIDVFVEKPEKGKIQSIWNKSSSNGYRNEEETSKKKWKNDDKSANKKNNSTLSLHIAAYENSINDGDTVSLGENEMLNGKEKSNSLSKKRESISSTTTIQNSFEFPRQQTGDKSDPAIMNFTASQQLCNPNQLAAPDSGPPMVQQNPQQNSLSVQQPPVVLSRIPSTLLQQQPQRQLGNFFDLSRPKRPRMTVQRPRYNVVMPVGYRPQPQNPFLIQQRQVSVVPPRGELLSSSTPRLSTPKNRMPKPPQPNSRLPELPPQSAATDSLGSSQNTPKIPRKRQQKVAETVNDTVTLEEEEEETEPLASSHELLREFAVMKKDMKKVLAENSTLRTTVTNLEAKFSVLTDELKDTKEKLQTLEDFMKNKRQKSCSNIRFVPTPTLQTSTFDIKYEQKLYRIVFKDYIQSDFYGKFIEEVVKLIAIRSFEMIIKTFPPPLNSLASYSSSSCARGNIMIPTSLFDDLIDKLLTCTSTDMSYFQLCQNKIANGINDKAKRLRAGAKKTVAYGEYVYDNEQEYVVMPDNFEGNNGDGVNCEGNNGGGDNFEGNNGGGESFEGNNGGGESFDENSEYNLSYGGQYITPKQYRRRDQWDYNPEVATSFANLHREPLLYNFGDYEIPHNDFDIPDTYENEDFNTDNLKQLMQQGDVTDKEWQLILITTYAIKENLTDAGIDRLRELFKAFVGEQFLVTTSDVKLQKKIWLTPFQVKEQIFCTDCKGTVANMVKKCKCGSDRSKRALISTALIIPQLLNFIRRNEEELLQERQQTDKRGDLLDYVKIREKIDELILYLIINTDGVMPKANSRKPFHPVFLLIKNLCAAKRSAMCNMLLPAIIHGVKSPEEYIWNAALGSLYEELQKLRNGIPYLCKDGTTIVVKAVITDTVIDQIEAKIVWGLASHNSYGYACTTCTIFPERGDNAQRWPLSSGELRETDYGIGLPAAPTAFGKIAPPSTYRLDGLHVLDEGLCKKLIYYLQNNYKVMQEVQHAVHRSLLKHGSNALAYSKSLKTLNGHQMRMYFTVAIPLLTTTAVGDIKIQCSFLFWLLCRLLYSKHLNVQICEEIAPTFELLGKAFEDNFGSLFKTIKSHRFFSHGATELQEHGTPADFSATTFEYGNRILKCDISPYITSGFDRSLVPRHLLKTVAEQHTEDMTKRCGLPSETYKSIYGSKSKPLMSQSHIFADELLPLMLENDQTFHSVYRNGLSFKFNPKKGEISYCKANCAGKGECYSVIVGIEREGQKFLLCKMLNYSNPVDTNLFEDSLKPIASILSKYQSLVFNIESEKEEFILLSLKDVLAFLLYEEFRDKKLLFDVSERYNKT